MAKVQANATCGWCLQPMIAPPSYNKHKDTICCCADHMILEMLFRIAFSDEAVNTFGFRRISLEKGNGS